MNSASQLGGMIAGQPTTNLSVWEPYSSESNRPNQPNQNMNSNIKIQPSQRHHLSLHGKSPNSILSGALHKRPSRLFLALGMALYASSAVAYAQTWDTVDDIFPGAAAGGVAAGAAGNVYVAGSMKDASGIFRAVVMKSADGGTNWDSDPTTPGVDEPTFTYSSSSGAASSLRGIASAQIGIGQTVSSHIVATGTAEGYQWLVCRSLNGGRTWESPDLYKHPGTVTSGGPVKPALDGNGNIYVGGTVTEQSRGKSLVRNLIRKYERSTGLWRTTTTTFPVTRLVCSGGSVFAISNAPSGTWQVRKSIDGGITWGALLDDYRFDLSSSSTAADAIVDSQGNLFVVGRGHRVTKSGSGISQTTLTDRFWIVRKGAAGGAQWTTLDVFDLGRSPVNLGGGQYAGAMSFANAVTVDSGDNLHVTGAGVGPTENLQHWVTRSLTVGSEGWTTHEFSRIPGVTSSQGTGVTADASGNLYSCGFSEGGADGAHNWLVRRALRPTP